MRKIGTLSVGKYGFGFDLSNDFKDSLHGNYELYIDIPDEEKAEGAKNTEQANQPDNSCEHSFSPVYQCVHCGKIGDSIA